MRWPAPRGLLGVHLVPYDSGGDRKWLDVLPRRAGRRVEFYVHGIVQISAWIVGQARYMIVYID